MKPQAGHRDTLSTKASAEEIAEATRRLQAWWAQRQQEARAQGRRLTYAQAGKALGITASAVSAYLKGRLKLSTDAAIRWAHFLDVAPEAIHPRLERMVRREFHRELDFELLREIIVRVEAQIDALELKVPPRVKAELIADLYAECQRQNIREKEAMESMLGFALRLLAR